MFRLLTDTNKFPTVYGINASFGVGCDIPFEEGGVLAKGIVGCGIHVRYLAVLVR